MQLLGIDDLAQLLRLSRRKVEQMLISGELPPPMRFGRLRRWHPESIDQWLSNRAGLNDTANRNELTGDPARREVGRPRATD